MVHYWSRGWLYCMGMPVMKSGPRPANARFVYVANHISYLDTVLIYAAVPQYFRTLAKKEMAAIPVFGFVYKQLAILVAVSYTHLDVYKRQDMDLAYAVGDVNAAASAAIGACAYTNSYIGSTVTTLYNYDMSLNILTTQIPPNNGTLNTVGVSGIVAVSYTHLDVYKRQVLPDTIRSRQDGKIPWCDVIALWFAGAHQQVCRCGCCTHSKWYSTVCRLSVLHLQTRAERTEIISYYR